MKPFRTTLGTAVALVTSLPSADSGTERLARLEFHRFGNAWQQIINASLIRASLVVLVAITTVTALATSASAQATLVVGTGNPDIDVPAVQAAVDQGGDVVLQGHFSFDRSPMIPTTPTGYPPAMVLISKAVAVSGARDEHGDQIATIYAGTIPFYVAAPGARVSIQGVRFVEPRKNAVLVYAVSGLVIASCQIEGAVPVDHGSQGIAIATTANPPTPMNPGKPENISGTIVIANNLINVAGGTALDHSLGVLIFSVGVPAAQVEVYISGNTISNANERSINLYHIDGRALIEWNVITTSTVVGNANVAFGRGTDVIHVTGTGSYLVAGNLVHSRWAAASGIRVQGGGAVWPITRAVVVDNDVYMEAPEGTVFDGNSSGIDVRDNAQDNVVTNNRIRGRASVALSVIGGYPPANNGFILNRVDEFEASLADVLVGEGVMSTLFVGQGTVEDHGVGTVVIPLPTHHDEAKREQKERDR